MLVDSLERETPTLPNFLPNLPHLRTIEEIADDYFEVHPEKLKASH